MSSVADETVAGDVGRMIRVDEGELRGHVRELVRDSVEETLDAMLDAEADAQCGARRHERSPEHLDTRAGYYERKLLTPAGEMTLQAPRLWKLPFETEIIERCKRRESSVEEAMIQMYLAGVSVRRVEDVTEALWGERASPGTVGF
jgi:putative transposase